MRLMLRLERRQIWKLVKATLSEDKSIISFTYTTPDYLAKTEREKLALYTSRKNLWCMNGRGKV